MNKHNMPEVEMEESLSVQVEEPSSTRKSTTGSWFQRITSLDDSSNQKHHRSVFIIVMSILHVFIYFSTYINISWKGQNFVLTLLEFCQLHIPCVGPAPQYIRTRIVSCPRTMTNVTCYYDDVLKDTCFSFIYPYQIWRLLTVNLFHTQWLHLLSNLLAQLLSGVPLERKYGSLRVAVIYWLSGLGASLILVITSTLTRKCNVSNNIFNLNYLWKEK